MTGKIRTKNNRRKRKRQRSIYPYHQTILCSVLILIALELKWNILWQLSPIKNTNDKRMNTLVERQTKMPKVTVKSLRDLGIEYNNRGAINISLGSNISHVSKGKEDLIAMLNEAGIHDVDIDVIHLLPTKRQIQDLYGDIRIIGLSQCEYFRKFGKAWGIAGLFDSGTNVAANYLQGNCLLLPNGNEILWQVPWGKHVPADMRKEHLHYDKKHHSHPNDIPDNDKDTEMNYHPSDVMPIVLIRDPYFWMQSMCQHNYGAQWIHSKEHCPNLVPNEVDFKSFSFPHGTVPVHIKFDFGIRSWDSLADLWMDWYNQYYREAEYPRLLVRYEDFVFRPKETTRQICQCAGGRLKDDFTYQIGSAKRGPGHGNVRTSWISAMIRYGSFEHRYDGMTQSDLLFAEKVLAAMMVDMSYALSSVVPNTTQQS
jgi:hypothetical protein